MARPTHIGIRYGLPTPEAWAPIPRDALLIAAGKFHVMDCEWQPAIEHATFYISCEDAEADGFPACRTCRPRDRHPRIVSRLPRGLVEEAWRRRRERLDRNEIVGSLTVWTRHVTVRFADGDTETFRLVPDGEGDGRTSISVGTPFAAAILQARPGETVRYPIPSGGFETVTVLEVLAE